MTVRTGGFIGLTHLVDEPLQEVAARAAEESVLYAFRRQELIDLISGHQGLGNKLLHLFVAIMSQRLRLLTDSLRQNINWTLQVSGLADLDISQLVADRAEIEIDLVNGKRLTGTLIKADAHESGFELFLATEEGTIHFIPYHAIVSAVLPAVSIGSANNLAPGI